jgi:hypothetical protein
LLARAILIDSESDPINVVQDTGYPGRLPMAATDRIARSLYPPLSSIEKYHNTYKIFINHYIKWGFRGECA